ncbi:drug/metabolite transporter (DMT)-like permease [Naumannella cuiyingiana]|uniref:Drug/metabolite transporter (DMT)-like permease n=1 Tax=Naumannella cuiyingiana TaxID=1347891 RepID=A0A7Z0ILU6_9ACTN|nr:EamA family transporter [Naumannella cuiyingiana]NYI71887.1 drug/metabolite transporter (DMT)-like permease [Naumannella cuiyingiana]
MTRRPGLLPLLALLGTVLAWSSAFLVLRITAPVFGPGEIALGRLAVGSVALGLIAWRRGITIPRGRALALLISYGVLWFGVYSAVLAWAENYLDAGTAALLVNLAPALVALYGAIRLGEGRRPSLFVGIAIALAGTALIAFGSASGPRLTLLGVALGLLAALLYAVGVITQKHTLNAGVDGVTATTLGCVIGMIATLPFAGSLIGQVATAPLAATLGIVWLGAIPTAAGFLLWAYALGRAPAGITAAASYLVPAVVIITAWLLLGEVPTPLALLGGALCLGGVVITRLPQRTPVGTPAGPPRPLAENDHAAQQRC